jgi:hypothetical protein
MKSGSGEAFHLVVVCQEILPSCRIRRGVSRDSSDPFGEQVIAQLSQGPGREPGRPAPDGGRAGDQADPLTLTDLPATSPAPFWVQRVEPPLVERVDHITHVVLADLQQRGDVPDGLTLPRRHHHDRRAYAPDPSTSC